MTLRDLIPFMTSYPKKKWQSQIPMNGGNEQPPSTHDSRDGGPFYFISNSALPP